MFVPNQNLINQKKAKKYESKCFFVIENVVITKLKFN